MVENGGLSFWAVGSPGLRSLGTAWETMHRMQTNGLREADKAVLSDEHAIP